MVVYNVIRILTKPEKHVTQIVPIGAYLSIEDATKAFNEEVEGLKRINRAILYNEALKHNQVIDEPRRFCFWLDDTGVDDEGYTYSKYLEIQAQITQTIVYDNISHSDLAEMLQAQPPENREELRRLYAYGSFSIVFQQRVPRREREKQEWIATNALCTTFDYDAEVVNRLQEAVNKIVEEDD